jgi:deoxyribonuclease IV
MKIGYHLSISEGLKKTAEFIKLNNINVVQIFSGSPRTYYPSKNENQRIFLKELNCLKFVHINYLVNLAKDNASVPKSIVENIKFCKDIDANGLIIHWGSNENINSGLKFTYENMKQIRQEIGNDIKILLETTAEGGNKLKLETLINFHFKYKDELNIGLCVDTAHIYAAGYDVFEIIKKHHNEIDLIHLNNPSPEVIYGNHLDRHNVSLFDNQGKFSNEEIYKLIKILYDYNLPMILETGDQHNDYLLCEKMIF